MVWKPMFSGMSGVRLLYQQTRWRSSGASITLSPLGQLLGLLRDVARRQRRPLAEEEVFHVLGDQILRFLLPGHQPVLVEDHLHAILPELPRLRGDVLVDPLAELAGPWRCIETRQLFLKFHTEDGAPARVGHRQL